MGKIYAGILITSDSISMIVGEMVESEDRTAPFAFTPYNDCFHDRDSKFNDLGEAQKILSILTASLVRIPDKLSAIGIASYGPLRSVGIQTRNRVYENQFSAKERVVVPYTILEQREILSRWPYGVIAETSAHKSIRDLDVYGIVRQQLQSTDDDYWNEIGVAVNTDVTCGALCEAFNAHDRKRNAPDRLMKAEDDTVVFLNLAEGVGGGFVVNKSTTGSANHPEMGYVTLRLDTTTNEPSPVYVEDIASARAILMKSEKSDWSQLIEEDWTFAVDSIAQLCASITSILSPHQIVVHGPVSRLTKQVDDKASSFAELVQQAMKKWMSVERGAPDGEARVPYVEYREMKEEDFIATSRRPSWPSDRLKEGSVDPMLYGALIYGAQVPAETESQKDG